MSKVLQNDFLSEAFKLQKGCKQGYPLSPYIFIIYAEIVSILVKNYKGIKVITTDDTQYLISKYADDTTFILDGSSASLNNYIKIRAVDYYSESSGLILSISSLKPFGYEVNSNMSITILAGSQKTFKPIYVTWYKFYFIFKCNNIT